MSINVEGEMARTGTDRGDGTLRAQWRARLQRFGRDGRTVAQFCAAEGISTWSFYDWRRKLRGEVAKAPAPAVANPRAAGADATGFIDAGVARVGDDGARAWCGELAAASRLELRIELGGGMVVRILRS